MGQVIVPDFSWNGSWKQGHNPDTDLSIDIINDIIDRLSQIGITGDTIMWELREIKLSFWDEGLAKIALYIQNEDDSSMSATRKSQLFWLMHFAMYNSMKPSAYILLSLHYAIRSWNGRSLQETIDFLKRELNDISMKQLIEEIGSSVVKEGWISRTDLTNIKTHLDLWGVQLPLF